MRVTRLAAGAVAALMMTGLTACGGGGTPAADAPSSAVASAGSSSAASSPSAAESPSGYDAQELLAAMKAAVAENKTSHITMDLNGGGQSMTGDGDISYEGESSSMQLELKAPQLGKGTIEMRMIDGIVYMAMPPMTPKGKFIKFDTNDPNSPFGQLGGLTGGDPLSSFEAFDAGLKKVDYVGQESVDGEDMDHYVLTVDARKAAKAQGMTSMPQGMPKTVDYDLWLDDQDLMRRMEFDMGGGGMTMTMSDWGEPVTIKAPPKSAVMKMPGAAAG